MPIGNFTSEMRDFVESDPPEDPTGERFFSSLRRQREWAAAQIRMQKEKKEEEKAAAKRRQTNLPTVEVRLSEAEGFWIGFGWMAERRGDPSVVVGRDGGICVKETQEVIKMPGFSEVGEEGRWLEYWGFE
ncbi:MAG: hypothetical protein PVI90_00345 [Desulfobacteraceae bacterium]